MGIFKRIQQWWLKRKVEKATALTIPKDSMSQLQSTVKKWAVSQWPNGRTAKGIAGHMKTEIDSLLGDLHTLANISESRFGMVRPTQKAAIQMAIGEIVLLALQFADNRGFDLHDAILLKLSENRKYTWSTPDDDGIVYRVDKGGIKDGKFIRYLEDLLDANDPTEL